MHLRSSFVLIFMIILIGCKDDNVSIASNNEGLSELQIYINDYIPRISKWGVINAKGEMVIPDIYDDIRDYSEGLASVNLEGLWGYIDINNKNVIDFQFKSAGDFIDGKALIQYFDNTFSLIDKKGTVLFKINDKGVRRGIDGVTRITRGSHSILKLENEEITFNKISSFKYGLALASNQDSTGVIDKKGRYIYVLQDDLSKIKICGVNKLCVKTKENQSYYYNILTNEKSQFYIETTAFNDGYAIVKLEESSAVIDSNYNIQFKSKSSLRYLGNLRWSEVVDQDGLNIKNLNGQTLNKFPIEGLYKYSDGLIAYKRNGLWGYLDKESNVVIDPILSIIWDRKNNFIRVLVENGFCYLNKNAELAFASYFSEARDFKNNLARVKR